MELKASPSWRISSRPATVTRSSMRPSASAWVALVSAKMRVMKERPQNQPRMTVPSSARPMATRSWLWSLVASSNASSVGCSTITTHGRLGTERASGEHLAAVAS